jgi:phage shock protein B
MLIGGGSFILGALFLTIVAPLWIFAHYLTQWRRSRGLSSADERTLAELWESTRRYEARIANLEQLLDAEVPGWRPPESDATAAPGASPGTTKVWSNGSAWRPR